MVSYATLSVVLMALNKCLLESYLTFASFGFVFAVVGTIHYGNGWGVSGFGLLLMFFSVFGSMVYLYGTMLGEAESLILLGWHILVMSASITAIANFLQLETSELLIVFLAALVIFGVGHAAVRSRHAIGS